MGERGKPDVLPSHGAGNVDSGTALGLDEANRPEKVRSERLRNYSAHGPVPSVGARTTPDVVLDSDDDINQPRAR